MEKAYIYIRIQPRDHSLQDAQEWKIQLDSPMIAEVLQPLPCVKINSHIKDFVVPTPKSAIIGHRKDIAQRLANLFTQKILETFEANDTVEGYSKKEWKEMHDIPEQYISPSQLHYIAKVYPEIIDKNDTEEFDKLFKLSDTSYWEVAARTINKIIDKKCTIWRAKNGGWC